MMFSSTNVVATTVALVWLVAALPQPTHALGEKCVQEFACQVFGVMEEKLWEDGADVHAIRPDSKEVPVETGESRVHDHSVIGYAECRLANGTTLFLAVDPVSEANRTLGVESMGCGECVCACGVTCQCVLVHACAHVCNRASVNVIRVLTPPPSSSSLLSLSSRCTFTSTASRFDLIVQ
jgi:hypothetical protein